MIVVDVNLNKVEELDITDYLTLHLTLSDKSIPWHPEYGIVKITQGADNDNIRNIIISEINKILNKYGSGYNLDKVDFDTMKVTIKHSKTGKKKELSI